LDSYVESYTGDSKSSYDIDDYNETFCGIITGGFRTYDDFFEKDGDDDLVVYKSRLFFKM